MSEHDRPAARGTSTPNALSFENYAFNFRVDLGARIAAHFGGAPAFARRRARLKEDLDAFWDGAAARYAALRVAAQEGRVDDEGREIRQALLRADGTDPLAAREHRRLLHRAGVDLADRAAADFARAWTRFVAQLDCEPLRREVADFLVCFPVESGMPLDPESQRYLWMGEPWEPPVAPTPEEVLRRFPPSLSGPTGEAPAR